jgi:hypothetical protein
MPGERAMATATAAPLSGAARLLAVRAHVRRRARTLLAFLLLAATWAARRSRWPPVMVYFLMQ